MSSLSNIFREADHNNVDSKLEELKQIAKDARDQSKVEQVAGSILKESELLLHTADHKSVILEALEKKSDLTFEEKVGLYEAIQEIYDSLERSEEKYGAVKECCKVLNGTINELRGSNYIPHIQRLPRDVVAYLLASSEDVNLAQAAQVAKAWNGVVSEERTWTAVAEKIGLTLNQDTTAYEQVKASIEGLRKDIKELKSIPQDVQSLLIEGLTVHSAQTLKDWKDARDTIEVWGKLAAKLNVTGIPTLKNCTDIQDTIDKAKDFELWMEENKALLLSLTDFDLSSIQLSHIPKEIGMLKNLETLFLWNNQLERIPDSIGELINLKNLYLSRNKLTGVPKTIVNLQKLDILHLANNNFRVVPEVIYELRMLTNLDLSNNHLSNVSEGIAKLGILRNLSLTGNSFEKMPEHICKLWLLEWLFIDNNELAIVTEDISKLQNLRRLSFSNNALKQFPEGIYKLQHLQMLFIENNKFKEVSEDIYKLVNLGELHITGNMLSKGSEGIIDKVRDKGVFVVY